MKISIVMATYNGAEYIIEQLDSLRLQSVPPDEVIICDDCSSDNTVQIITKYIEQNCLESKWKILTNAKNIGYGANFKKVALLASGKFIFFADQDDIWDLFKVEKMIAIMDTHPDCNLLSSDYEIFSSELIKIPGNVKKRMPNNGVINHLTISNKSMYIGALGCCMCIRKNFLDSISNYDFGEWTHDDRMWRMGLCSGGSYILHSNLTKHRIHNHNTATFGKYHDKNKRLVNFRETKYACREMLRYLKNNNSSIKIISLVEKHYKMMDLRIDMIENKHFWNAFFLFLYLPCYLSKKSWLVDLIIMFK